MPGKLKTAVLRRDRLFRPGVDADFVCVIPGWKSLCCCGVTQIAGGASDLADVFPALSGNGGYPLHPLSWQTLKQHGVSCFF